MAWTCTQQKTYSKFIVINLPIRNDFRKLTITHCWMSVGFVRQFKIVCVLFIFEMCFQVIMPFESLIQIDVQSAHVNLSFFMHIIRICLCNRRMNTIILMVMGETFPRIIIGGQWFLFWFFFLNPVWSFHPERVE